MRTLHTRSISALAAVALAFASCRIEKPATVVPAAPVIDTFAVSATSVDKGSMVTVSWKVSNATKVELREASSGALPVAENTFDGTYAATVDATSLFVLVARGEGGSDSRALSVDVNDTGATDLNFQALPPVVLGGQDSTLVWTAPGARNVTLTAGATTVDIGGQRASGAVTVSPAFDTQYTLVADGKTKTVTVAVQPAVLTLEATPVAVESGDMITLRWTAAGAEKIEVSSAGRGVIHEETTAAAIQSGTYSEVAPSLPPGSFLTYEVTAVKGTERLSKTAQVYVGSGLSIVRFDAPAVAAAGLSYTVRWQTLAADLVVLKVDGAVVHQSASALDAALGQYSFSAPTRDFTIELEASDVRGTVKRQVAQVDSVGVPSSITLSANPTTAASRTQVTLTWSSTEARRIRIVDSDGVTVFSTTGQRAESGTVDVYPDVTTTYTATADNQLGSVPVTAQTTVTVTGAGLSVVQNPRTALSGQVVNLTTPATGAIFSGFPHTQTLAATRSDFLDISATGTRVLESGGNVVSTNVAFSSLLWGVTQQNTLTVSRAGWAAFRAPLVPLTSESALPSISVPAFIIAPYWDDLTLNANSAVFVQVVGDAPNQQLVVQWDHMQCGTTANTEATFQLRLNQNGQTSFHYKTMVLNSSPSFSIGVQDGTRTLAVRSTVTPTTNSALYLFSPVAQPEIRVQRGATYGGFVTVGNARTRISSPAASVSFPLDISISEFMFRPSPLVTKGQYVELINRTLGPLDLSGWTVASTTTATSWTIPSLIVPAGQVVLLGESTDALENDDAGIQLAWSGLTFARDSGAIAVGTADASIGFTYTGPADGGTGASVEVDPGPFINSSGTASSILACNPSRTFGSQTPLQRGSPGAQVSCFGYLATAIPAHFVDLADAGTALINAPTAVTTTKTVTIALASDAGTDPAPMPFGVRQPVVTVSLEGWLFWGTTTSTNASNKSSPTTTTPIALVAPFWDDLEAAPTLGRTPDLYWKRIAPNEDPLTPAGHWIFQWSHVSHQQTAVLDKGLDDFNFEVKLFEDGTIEYHYGVMTSGTVNGYADGNSATVWFENLAGNFAMFRSINQPLVRPNTAVRFTPAP